MSIVFWALVALFAVSEAGLSITRRPRSRKPSRRDRLSLMLVWVGVAIGAAAALLARNLPATRLHLAQQVPETIGLVLIVAGLSFRWWAIIHLGRYFVTSVSVEEGQPVVQSGPYRVVRHPSYAGELLAFVGIGVFLANWLSLVVLLVPVVLAFLNRVRFEESVLREAFGAPYADYCARVKRLIPGIF
jgi:protein-S-isoprenylcysteine O-methyltransferase